VWEGAQWGVKSGGEKGRRGYGRESGRREDGNGSPAVGTMDALGAEKREGKLVKTLVCAHVGKSLSGDIEAKTVLN